jgi:hypothetical protein
LYYRTWYNGKAYWVPSIWIDGFPPSRPPLLPPVASNLNTVAWREAIDAEYQATKNLLGNPISDYFDAARSPQGTSGKFRVYQNGTIHWSPQYGAVAIWYDLQREYTQYSSPNGSGGWLGFPTKREYPWNNGKRTNFEGGYIFWDGQRAKAYPSTPPATPGKQREYIIKTGDTLTGIAQRELGNANRWGEIVKTPSGGIFTTAEAQQLRVGQSVYLPVSYQTGTGNPVTQTPATNPTPVENIILKPGATNLNFSRGQKWITSTGYKFIFQNDGNLVLYNPQGKPIWATGTDGTGADRFSVQADGNVVLYDRGKPVWATVTYGNSGAYFAIQGDGNLVVYSSNGKPLFNTGTYNGRTGTVTASSDWLKKFRSGEAKLVKFGDLSSSVKQAMVADFPKKDYGSPYADVSSTNPKTWIGTKNGQDYGAGQQARYIQDSDMPVVADPQQRSPEQIRQVIDYFNVGNSNISPPDNKRYWNPNVNTYCNIFAKDVMYALRAPLPYWVGLHNQNADDMYNWLSNSANGWRKVTAAEAAKAAGNGTPALVCGSGHIAVVRPPESGDDPNNPRIAQAGLQNFVNGTVSKGWGQKTHDYFVYNR